MTTALASAWTHGPGKRVVADRGSTVRITRPTGAPWTSLRPEWVTLLREALSPQWWDPWTQHHDHRATPAVRPVRGSDVFVRLGRSWLMLDPVRELVVGSNPVGLDPPTELRLQIRPDDARLPAGYGALRSALALLEVGHVAAALVTAARRRGVRPITRTGEFGAEVVIPVGTDARRAVPRLPRRTSGTNPCGLALDPRPLPVAALDELLATARQLQAGSLGSGLGHRIAVHRVAGLADGVLALGGTGTRRIRSGRVGDAVAAAFRASRTEIDVGAANVVWSIVTDLVDRARHAAAVPGADAAWYPATLVDVGACAQYLSEAAARHGLFCRPTRAIDEADLEAALGCAPGDDVLYSLVIGRCRASAPIWDLSPARPLEGEPR